MRRVSVFGATGSVGVSTLDLLARRPDVQVAALTGGRNVALLARQAVQQRAELAVTAHEDCYRPLKEALAGTGIACGQLLCAPPVTQKKPPTACKTP